MNIIRFVKWNAREDLSLQKRSKTRGSIVIIALCSGSWFSPIHSQQGKESRVAEITHWCWVMEACPRQQFVLKALLNTFASSIGLKVNNSKSSMFPINVPKDRIQHLAAIFHYQTGPLPFTYHGLPLSLIKPIVHDCWPLVERVEMRLANTSIFLSQGGKL
jgi:hypothetical protein